MRPPLRCMAAVMILASLPARSAQGAAPELAKAARAAYDSAVKAHERGDFAGAAREFAHADRLIPNDGVLKDAIREALRADSAVIGLMLVARAARSPNNADLQAVAANASERFRGRAGRIEIECPGSCALEVDGQSPDPNADGWVTVGPHVVVLKTDAHRDYLDEHRIEVLPLQTTRVQFVPPVSVRIGAPTPTEPTPTERHVEAPGISPAWFWVGAGLTAALAGATTISGLDVSSRRRAFSDQGCSRAGSDACDESASDGRSAVTRTNVLLGATAAVGAATLATVFFVRWKPTVTTSLGADSSGARVAVTGRF